MKKRIKTLMFMTLMAFLFSGLTTLNAQVTTASAASGKVVLVDYVDNTQALSTVVSEIQTNYPDLNLAQPTNQVAAQTYYRQAFLINVRAHLGAGLPTASAINMGYREVSDLAAGNWPNLVDGTWEDDMISLLSN